MIYGYKCFNEGLVSQYDDRYEENRTYHVDGEIKFNQNGFHMCERLEDTLRFFDGFTDEIEIAYVVGFGKINMHDDEYYEYFNMYAVENIKIIHVLTREEIIQYALSLPTMRLKRFLSLFRLTKEEITLFKERFFKNDYIISTIEYYQEKDKDAYIKRIK